MKRFAFLFLLLLSGVFFLSSVQPAIMLKTSGFNDSVFCWFEEQESVFNQDFVRRDLYTWTTTEQIQLLRNNKKLLTKSQSEKYGKAIYDLMLEERSKAGDPIATFLLQDAFAKKRFSWPHPWATVRGYPNENYGDQLLRIRMKEEAIYGNFVTSRSDTTFHFYSSTGKQLDPDFVMLHPERLAVVYFVHAKKTKKKEAHYRGTYSRHYNIKTIETEFPYREYVICNESMIEEWSYGTQMIKAEIKKDIRYLTMLIEAINIPPNNDYHGCSSLKGYDKYLTTDRGFEWESDYRNNCCNYIKTVALINEYYDLNEKQLKKTISLLNSVLPLQGDSIIVKN